MSSPPKDQKDHAALLLALSRGSRAEGRFYSQKRLLEQRPVMRFTFAKQSLKRKYSEIVSPQYTPANILAPEVAVPAPANPVGVAVPAPANPVGVAVPAPANPAGVAVPANPKTKQRKLVEQPVPAPHKFLPNGTTLGYRYLIVEKRGSGGFGCVYACRDMSTNQMVAVKVFKQSEFFKLSARNEVKTLTTLNRVKVEGVIRLLDHFEWEKKSCVVMELCDTSLYTQLQTKFKTGFPLPNVRQHAKQLLQAVLFLHSEGMVHSDLKPDNLGLVGDTVKLLDLGSCKPLSKRHLFAQTLRYRAPEVLMELPSSSPIDLWAIGCTLVELFTGICWFRTGVLSVEEKQKNWDQLVRIIKTLGLPPESMVKESKLFSSLPLPPLALESSPLPIEDPTFKSLILGLLEYDPSKRLSAKQALDHPFFL